MRALFIAFAVLTSGCKSAEIAVTHPLTGIHFAARLEAMDTTTVGSHVLLSALPAAPNAATIETIRACHVQ